MARKKKNSENDIQEHSGLDSSSAESKQMIDTQLLDEDNEKLINDQFFKWPIWIVFFLGFLLYAQTLRYDYALDDKLVITHNFITKKGFAGIDDHFQTDFLVGFFGKQKNLLEGGRYRPLSLVSFSVENELFGDPALDAQGRPVVTNESGQQIRRDENGELMGPGDETYIYNPLIGHLFNAIYYALIGLVLFLTLYKVFPPDKRKAWYLSFPLIATLIFVVHPTHTEVVANIKGRDELMSLLFGLGTLYFSITYAKERGIINLVLSGLCFLLAMLSKEGVITFIAVIPMTIFYFTKEKWKDIAIVTSPLIIITVLYFIFMRIPVLGQFDVHYEETGSVVEAWTAAAKGSTRSADQLTPELMNMPFMYTKQKAIERNMSPWLQENAPSIWPSITYTLGYYVKLLFVPHPLTHDYYPWHPLGSFMYNQSFTVERQVYPYLKWSDPRALLSLIIYLGLIFYAVKDLYQILIGKKEKNIVSYCLWFYLGTLFLVSNIPFQVGTFMNERLIFVPSIAFAILITHFLLNWLPKKYKDAEKYQKTVTSILGITLVLFSLKTISRNESWHNDFTLSVGDVEVSGNSAKSNMSAGLALVDESKKYRDSEPAKAKEMLDRAERHLAKSLNIYPRYIQPMLIMGNCYYEMAHHFEVMKNQPNQIKSYDNAILYFEKCLKLNPQYEYSVKNLEHVGDLCSQKKLFATSIKSYETLIKYDKRNIQRIEGKLAAAYSNSGTSNPNAKDFLMKEISKLEEQLKEDPNNIGILVRLGEYYGKNLGNLPASQKYLERAYSINPESSDVLQKLGVVYAMQNQHQNAINIFSKALEKNPDNPHVMMNIGIAYRNMGESEKAQQYLNKAFELDPTLKGGGQ